ncbi:MAG: hypothetical protein ABSG66_06790 [Stellaceae bacterium]|jgi:hypothetical protein
MKTPWLFSAVLLTASAIVPPAAFAACDEARWSNPSLLADYPPVGDHEYAILKSAWVNPDGNLQVGTTNVRNDSTGLCTLDIVWEIDCRRQAARPLQARSHYDSDWPTDKDSQVEGDKIWKNYGVNAPMSRVANMFCGRLNQLPRVSP